MNSWIHTYTYSHIARAHAHTCIQTRLIRMCDMSLFYVWCEPFVNVICLYVWHDSFACVTWPIRSRDMPYPYVWYESYVRQDSFARVACLVHMCDMTYSHVWLTHSHVWHDSSLCVTWLVFTCDITSSYMRLFSFICDMPQSYATWLIYICAVTRSYLWHGSLVCVSCIFCICDTPHSLLGVTWLDCIRAMTLACV